MRKMHGNVMTVAILAAGLVVAGRAMAGSLDPTNTPGPTMHTLEEIYQGLTGGTVTVIVNNTVLAGQGMPKTGQTTSYQTGDDGTYQKGVAWPNPRFTVQGDTNTVMDNLTGLVWARNANLGGAMTWSNAIVYCEDLTYGGHSDWRLPNWNELRSLLDASKYELALPSEHPFVNFEGDYQYWSSTTVAVNPDFAWSVELNNGILDGRDKTSTHYVWPVRGGQ